EHGVLFGEPSTDIDIIRIWKEKVVSQLTRGLKGMAKMRKVTTVNGFGRYTGANTIEATSSEGQVPTVP
ncbi:dihydrolipoyl dehydrogenase, partial [Psychromonas aquatilis]